MKKTAVISALTMALVFAYSPVVRAAHTETILGAAIGGATGAALGREIGGRDGAIVWAALGGATGAAIGNTLGHRHEVMTRRDWDDDEFVVRRHVVHEPVRVYDIHRTTYYRVHEDKWCCGYRHEHRHHHRHHHDDEGDD